MRRAQGLASIRPIPDIRNIDLDHKPDSFLRQFPTGKVPIPVMDDTVLFELAAISE